MIESALALLGLRATAEQLMFTFLSYVPKSVKRTFSLENPMSECVIDAITRTATPSSHRPRYVAHSLRFIPANRRPPITISKLLQPVLLNLVSKQISTLRTEQHFLEDCSIILCHFLAPSWPRLTTRVFTQVPGGKSHLNPDKWEHRQWDECNWEALFSTQSTQGAPTTIPMVEFRCRDVVDG